MASIWKLDRENISTLAPCMKGVRVDIQDVR
jgi:phosphotransferase system IIB component